MNENLILAKSLLEWTENSHTEFIEDAKIADELKKVAEKRGIVLPSPDLAIFKTIYAEIDKPNRNKVILRKDAVEKGLATLIGKQINWEHDDAGRICGHILDAKIEENFIIVYGALFKSLFREEFDEVEKLFKQKKLFVSFEIWNQDEEGKSVLNYLQNGLKEIVNITFHGCGLLLKNPPACPKAHVMMLASDSILDEASDIANKVFNKKKDERLVYAELAFEEQNQHPEGGNIMADEITLEHTESNESKDSSSTDSLEGSQKSSEETKTETSETQATEVVEEKKEEAVVETKTEEVMEESKKDEVKEEAKTEEKIEEANFECECLKCGKIFSSEQHCRDTKCPECGGEMRRKDRPGTGKGEDEKKEEAAEVQETPTSTSDVTMTTKQSVVVVDNIKEGVETISTDIKVEKVVEDESGKSTQTREVTEVVTYTREQYEALKAEYDAKLVEKDTEIAQLKQELGNKDQEIANLKVEKAQEDKSKEEEQTPDLSVGSVMEQEDRYAQIRRGVNERAFPTKK